jgi:hypothetical protein
MGGMRKAPESETAKYRKRIGPGRLNRAPTPDRRKVGKKSK